MPLGDFLLAVAVSVASAKTAQVMINGYLGRKATLCRRRSPVEVAGIRAAAAVWKYNISTEELNLHWLMDDDSKHNYQLGLRRLMSTNAPLAAECEVGGQCF